MQAVVIGMTGYGMGLGLVVVLIEASTMNLPHPAGFVPPWRFMVVTGTSMMIIMVVSGLLNIGRVFFAGPTHLPGTRDKRRGLAGKSAPRTIRPRVDSTMFVTASIIPRLHPR